MATYKVIQDIEADDKLLGPLTLRQFSYAGITVFCLWLCFFVASHGAAFLILAILPFALVSSFFAVPWSREQPTEIWALARVRFLLKPRRRIWDQSGMRELVTITAPKRIEHIYSDGLSQLEVKSRLRALAETIDTRGWAIKNADLNPYAAPAFPGTDNTDDRLIDPSTIPQDVPVAGTDAYEDVLDPATSQTAQQFDNMLHAQSEAQRERLMHTMAQPAGQHQDATQPPADYWFLNQTTANNLGTKVVLPGSIDATSTPEVSTIEEREIVEQLEDRKHRSNYGRSHMPSILPLEEQEKRKAKRRAEQAKHAPKTPAPSPMTATPDPVILGLAENDDLNIATLKREADRHKARNEDPNDEVVISLR
jgi:hypothetical protein